MSTLKKIQRIIIAIAFAATLGECLADPAAQPRTEQLTKKEISTDEKIAFCKERISIEKILIARIESLVKEGKSLVAREKEKLSKIDLKAVSDQLLLASATIETIKMRQKEDEAELERLIFFRKAEKDLDEVEEKVKELLKTIETNFGPLPELPQLEQSQPAAANPKTTTPNRK